MYEHTMYGDTYVCGYNAWTYRETPRVHDWRLKNRVIYLDFPYIQTKINEIMYRKLVFYAIHRNPWKIRCMDARLHTLYGKSSYFTWISGFIQSQIAYNLGDNPIFRVSCTSKNQVNFLDSWLWTRRANRNRKVLRISRSFKFVFVYIVLVDFVRPPYLYIFLSSIRFLKLCCSYGVVIVVDHAVNVVLSCS